MSPLTVSEIDRLARSAAPDIGKSVNSILAACEDNAMEEAANEQAKASRRGELHHYSHYDAMVEAMTLRHLKGALGDCPRPLGEWFRSIGFTDW